ncbi:hydantoinase B/oxoprolinase family protein [Pollutimonas bauzanensis]|uniref:N-methylhydantoinase B n=1 Tax=Pollutimonas bauzanensis TaxID=658167 RepID=A0A1M5NK54_9BURK|nr:hydantoinase B/oxoprolinase family protein [Pollutimonas bauzanensis]SHG89825.1 N-methylhydantoinase B [Pollutimonas bauzanensis]
MSNPLVSSHEFLRKQVMWTRLLSVVEEQAQVLMRTAFGTSTREAGDLSAGIFLPDGRMIAQAVTGTPGHVNSMAESVKHFLDAFPASGMKGGDVYLTNDPWKATGHLFDMTMVTPVVVQGRVLALFASTLHVVDVGGIGSSSDGLEIYHEGLFLPILRFIRQGEVDAGVLAIVRANVREPEQVEGDLFALVACNEVGGRRLLTMLDEFSLASLEDLGGFIIERSAAAMVQALKEWRHGTYSSSMVIDGYDEPIELRASVSIGAEGIDVDFAGTSPSVARGINVPKAYTDAYTSFGIRCLIGQDIPNNAGSLDPISIRAPEGSIVHALHPSPVTARHVIGQMLPDVMFGALRQARPDRVPAEGSSSLWNIHLVGGTPIADGPNRDLLRGPRFNVTSFSTGGTGARPRKDGLSTTSCPSGVRNVSLEVLETLSPLLFLRKEFRTDSGGIGELRGGLGQTIEVRHADPSAAMIVAAAFDRIRFPARGALGGGPGAPGNLLLGSGAVLKGKGRQVVPAGDYLIVQTPGGGGLGSPALRDPLRLASDRNKGLVSAAGAASYGAAGAEDSSDVPTNDLESASV